MKKILTIIALFTVFHSSAQNSGGRFNNSKPAGAFYSAGILEQDKNYYSPGNQFYVTFQSDGNLVVTRAYDKRVMWHSQTSGLGGAKCEFQNDGNLVISKANGAVIWNAFADKNNQYKKNNTVVCNATDLIQALLMQNDGNLVIYSGSYKNVKWASGSIQ